MDETNQKKKMLLMGIIVTVIIFVVVLVVLLILMAQENKKTKIQFGNQIYKTTTVEVTAEDGIYQQKSITLGGEKVPAILVTPEKNVYYNIETISKIAGYKYNNGAYGSDNIDETKDKCYIDNGGEYVNFFADTNEISKNIKENGKYNGELKILKQLQSDSKDSNELDVESFTLDNPVLLFEDSLYASPEAINKGLNMLIVPNGSTVQFYTLEELTKGYSSSLSQKGYSLTSNFKNQRALSSNYAVVGKDNEYGVVDLTTNKEVISLKYDSVEYVQSIGEFIVSSGSNFGMIKPGESSPTIKLEYDSIKLLDASRKLYIVEKNNKFGVLSAKGEEVIPTEYDQIGLSSVSAYKSQGITNKYIIAGECIPVMRNKSFGLYGVDGQLLASTRFSAIGCETPGKIIDNTSAMPTLTMPLSENVTGIVFAMTNSARITSYGLITTKGTIVLNAYYTAIYYMQRNGNTTYYFNKPANDELLTLKQLLATRATVRELIEQTRSQEEKDAEAQREQDNIDRANNQSSTQDDGQDENQDESSNGDDNPDDNSDNPEDNQDDNQDENPDEEN